jgi:hypothetical protein
MAGGADYSWLWDVNTVDTVVFLLIILVPLYFAFYVVKSFVFREMEWPRITEAKVVIAGGLLAVFVAYAALRNQAMLESEGRISDQGYDLLAIEMAHEEVRCLYGWGDSATGGGCIEKILENDKWSLTLLYAEEVLFLFKDARELSARFNSEYYKDIQYWVDDVSEDSTGLFGYYAVFRGGGERGGVKFLSETGVTIQDVCANYTRVYRALERKGRAPVTAHCAVKPLKAVQ